MRRGCRHIRSFERYHILDCKLMAFGCGIFSLSLQLWTTSSTWAFFTREYVHHSIGCCSRLPSTRLPQGHCSSRPGALEHLK
jgi:hypothetical protein